MNTINSTIQYLTITSPEQIAPYTGQLLTLYKSVFGDRIWNEGMKCSNDQCSFQSSFEDTPSDNTCSIPSCRNPLKEFYSNTEISETLQRLFKKKFELIIALQNSIPVGFYWGWEASLDSLNEEKLGLSSAQYGTLKQNLTQYYPLFQTNLPLFYSAEIGVTPAARGQKISLTLFQKALQKQLEKLSSVVVLSRTSRNSPQWSIRAQQGFELVYDYADVQRRGIFAKVFNSSSRS